MTFITGQHLFFYQVAQLALQERPGAAQRRSVCGSTQRPASVLHRPSATPGTGTGTSAGPGGDGTEPRAMLGWPPAKRTTKELPSREHLPKVPRDEQRFAGAAQRRAALHRAA